MVSRLKSRGCGVSRVRRLNDEEEYSSCFLFLWYNIKQEALFSYEHDTKTLIHWNRVLNKLEIDNFNHENVPKK